MNLWVSSKPMLTLCSPAASERALGPLLPPTAHLIYTSDLEDSRITDATVWVGSKKPNYLNLYFSPVHFKWNSAAVTFPIFLRHTLLKSFSGAYT